MLDLIFQGAGYFMNPFFFLGIGLWNLMVSLIGFTSVQTPGQFSSLTWNYVAYSMYPWAAAIGAVFMNLSYCIGILRHAGNLKENFTLEVFVEACIKVLLGNIFLTMGIELMQALFRLASALTGSVLMEAPVMYMPQDNDIGSFLFYLIFGVVFFLVCLVCSGMIFLTVYGRYLQLYLLVCTMPFAVATLPGGSGMSQTAYAWLRTFLAKVFEIVGIALALVIASKMSIAIDFGDLNGAGEVFDGALQALQNLCTMVLLTATVKGMDSFMRRAFAL